MELLKELVNVIAPNASQSIYLASGIKRLSLVFKSEGVAFDVNALVDAIDEHLNDDASLIIPAYTDTLPSGAEFDKNKTKPTIGAIPNRIFRRKDFFRTKDPLHSAFIKGDFSQCDFTATSTFGDNSLFYNMLKANVRQVFIDVDLQNSFTFIHYVEELKKVAYRKHYTMKYKVEGSIIELLFHTRKPGYITKLDTLQQDMLDANVLHESKFHGISIYWLNTAEAFSYLSSEIDKHGGKPWRYFSWKAYFRRVLKRIVKQQAI